MNKCTLRSLELAPVILSALGGLPSFYAQETQWWAYAFGISSIIIIIYLLRDSLLAKKYANGIWMRRHGFKEGEFTILKRGSFLVAKDQEQKEYVVICSFCTTGQIDRFVDACRAADIREVYGE